jgi:hypothetical protein
MQPETPASELAFAGTSTNEFDLDIAFHEKPSPFPPPDGFDSEDTTCYLCITISPGGGGGSNPHGPRCD